jgi:two-component system, LytTR family, sensor kinase
MAFQRNSTSRFLTVLIHIVLWSGILFVPLLFIDWEPGRIRYLWFQSFLLGVVIVYYYVNSRVFIPKLFLKKKTFLFIVSLAGSLLAISLLNYAWGLFMDATVYSDMHGRHHSGAFRLYAPLIPFLMAFGISTSIRIIDEWLKNEKQKKEMETEKLQSELAFLKSQVNPHFLFNILNNICALARKKSDDTENAIIKLSQIMRYMMYDSKNDKVMLGKELEYLQNYIELQRMRISETVRIDFTVSGDPEAILLEPLLLIPFVENAFKHGVSYLEESWITINLQVTASELNFHVGNKIIRQNKLDVPAESGIGLKNVKRRLELLYPGRHEIRVNETDAGYIVDLTIHF